MSAPQAEDPPPAAEGPAPAAEQPPLAPRERRSPYDHLLRVGGDVGSTPAIALFLAGLSAMLLTWILLSAGGPDVRSLSGTVAEDGRLPLPAEVGPETPIWGERWDLLQGDAPLEEGTFRRTADGRALEFPASARGQQVALDYDLGREPIVSHFLLPKPGEVVRAIVELLKGPSYQVACPNKACPSRPNPVFVGASDGDALEDYRLAAMRDPATPRPGIACPSCGQPLDGEIAVPRPAHFFRHGLLSTLGRTGLGFLIAVAICFPLGVAAGAFPPIKRLVSPLEIFGGYAPPVVLLPLAVALTGVLSNSGVSSGVSSEVGRVSFLVVVIAFWLYPLITSEVAGVDEVFVNTAYTLGATRWQAVKDVLVPISLSNNWEHMRSTYAIGWASIILAEGYGAARESTQTGIGFFMVDMQRRHLMDNYFSALLVIVVTGLLIDYGFRVVGRWLFPYREAS